MLAAFVLAGVWSACAAAVAQPLLSPGDSLPPGDGPAVPGGSLVFPEGFPEFDDDSDGPAVRYPGLPNDDSDVLAPETTDYPPLSDDAEILARELSLAEYVPDALGGRAALPAYYYRPSYYQTSDLGARPIADYAPPGFEAREFQDAPGAPEFTALTPPPAVDNNGVVRGMMPGSILIPGSPTSFRIRGFARLGGTYDFDPIGSRDDFVTSTIPVPQSAGQNVDMSARYSRIALETWTPTAIREWTAHTFIEGDFFNGPAQAAGAGGNAFRLRFAFVDFGYFRFGQQNSVFMDGNAWPSVADFAGPRGLANQRRPGARVTLPLADRLYWAAGIEQPFSDVTTNGLGTNVQDTPDLASHLRYEGDLGHLQISGIARAIGYDPTDGDVTRRGGLGGSVSTVFHPWAALTGSAPVHKVNATGLERSRVLLQATAGHGVARYLQDTTGLGLDGQVDPLTEAFDLPMAVGWTASYEHWYSERWLTNVTYSQVDIDSVGQQANNTYNGAKYLAASLWWVPVRNFSAAIEYLHGVRENLDGASGEADRIQGLLQYNF